MRIQSPERPDNIPLAISVIVFTVLALSLGDALIKQGSSTFSLWQIFVLRSVIAIPVLIGFILIYKRQILKRIDNLAYTVLRSLLLVTMWVLYYLSLPHLSLSVAAAAYYTLPLFITLFSAIFIGEKVRPVAWLAVALGFSGVLLILKPSTDDFNGYALLPIASAILYALAMILTRTRCRNTHPLMLSLALNVTFIFVGALATLLLTLVSVESEPSFIFAPWSTMELGQWFSMSLLAIAILIGSIGAAIAYQNGPSSVVGVFDFGYVGFAVLWSMVFFKDYPDIVSVSGMLLIVVAGIISVRS